MKLLIVSDTHGMNTNELINIIKQEKANVNIHAGDYMMSIDEMKKHFQYFVDGNNDCEYKNKQEFQIDKFKFLLVHGHEYFDFNYESWIKKEREKQNDIDVIIFGHSHIPLIDTSSKPYFINPGSFSLPRGDKNKTYIIGNINNNEISFQLKCWK